MSYTQTKLTPVEIENRNRLKVNKPLVYEKVIKYGEKFRNGESIAIIQLQYDYTCNFRCQHCAISCLQKKKSDRFFKPDDIRELSRQADEMGLAHINISGGEPLVFPDLDEVIKAFDPEKFYMQCDTNGWLMTDELAKHLKSIGIDRMQVSIDSLDPKAHDSFRRQLGSHQRAIKAIDSMLKAGLNMQIATVVTKQRLRTDEFIEFLKFAKSKGAPVSVVWSKPVGAWEGNFDGLIDKDDMEYFRKLEKQCRVYDHLTPGYGIDSGCCAVKRMVNITKWGDVLPCCWMYFSLGNFFKEPLKDIIARGMGIKHFSKHTNTCLMSEDLDFINKYVTKTYGKDLPVPIEEIITPE
jgi:MoaA/NifB/PqqE/SkfB family radical SAM enzyme